MDLRVKIKRLPQKKFDILSNTLIFSVVPLSILSLIFMLSNSGSWLFWVGWSFLVFVLMGHNVACQYILWARYSCDVCKKKHCLEHWDESERPGK